MSACGKGIGATTSPSPAASPVFLLGLPELASVGTMRPSGGIYSIHCTECLESEKTSPGQISCLDLSEVEKIQKPLQPIIVFPTPAGGHCLRFPTFS